MAISETIQKIGVDDLYLDPRNPRLGRRLTAKGKSQDALLEWMFEEGVLDELAVSFIESGFWIQEALVVVHEKIAGKKVPIVVEGNRRLAALKWIFIAKEGGEVTPKWRNIVNSASANQLKRLKSVPYVEADSREEVQSYLGFRHVSGIKEWNPAEKAEFIANLIDKEKLSYEQVMRRIGSKTTSVRQNYISYRILLQMEKNKDKIDVEKVEDRFSVLYLSLRTIGVQQYLDINIQADPKSAKTPVPKRNLKHLVNFALWLFGDKKRKPIVRDSRDTDNFGRILESKDAVQYLERTEAPTFDTAFRIAGGSEEETARHVERAADEIEQALGTAHHHKRSKRLQSAVLRVGNDAIQLLNLFPKIRDDVLEDRS